MKNRILIAEISGKRPGTSKQRPTEKFDFAYDKVIISNNSEGYTTDWEIVNVPNDYREWYIANHKNSDNAWYAPMNRSYAIKYARERGYRYLVQCDDNIKTIEIGVLSGKIGDVQRRIRIISRSSNVIHGMINSFIEMFETVLENTNAVMVGCDMAGVSAPAIKLLAERYCYSFFMLDLEKCPDVFHGDFEDDIEYRLKCYQMGSPVVQICPLRYAKIGQDKTKDLSGCREEYLKAGIKRGAHMSVLYNDVYKCKMRQKGQSITSKYDKENVNFKHILKTWKVGVVVYDMEAIQNKFNEIVAKYYTPQQDKIIVKEKRVRRAKSGKQ